MATVRIGLDIGHAHVRAVALRGGGKQWSFAGAAAVNRMGDGEPKPLAGVLAELDAQLGLKAGLTVASGDVDGLIRFLTTAPLPPDRLTKVLRLELEQHLDEAAGLAADHTTLQIGGDEQIHCCIVAQPTQVFSLLVDLRAAGVEAGRVHSRAPALANLAIAANVGGTPLCDEDGCALIIDIGAHTTAVALVGSDRLLACRVLPVGGESFTENIAGTERISREQAEAAKLSGQLPAQAPAPSTIALDPEDPFAAMLDEGLSAPGEATIGMANASFGPQLAKAAEGFHAQIAASLQWFRSQVRLPPSIQLKRAYICGGGAGLKDLDTYLSRRLQVPVSRLDQLPGIGGPAPDRVWEYATATALALSDALPGAIAIDLRPDVLLKKQAWRQRVLGPLVGAAALVVAGVVGAWTLFEHQQAAARTIENFKAAEEDFKKASEHLKKLDQERDALATDLRAIAGRIYAGRDFLNVIRALKEEAADDNSKFLWVTRLETVGVGNDKPPIEDIKGRIFGAEREAKPKPNAQGAADTTIDRGAVVISGYMKYRDITDKDEIRKIFTDYYKRIGAWRPSKDAPQLFQATNIQDFTVMRAEDSSRKGLPDGTVVFKIMAWFQPTDLTQVTSTTTTGKGK